MKLSDWMAAKALKDDQVAPMLGISRVHTSRIRRGICRPSWDVAQRIQRATKGAVTPNDFATAPGAVR